MSKEKSEVWNFFLRKGNNSASCKICGKQIKTGGGTTNLKNHLIHKHPSCPAANQAKKQKTNTAMRVDTDAASSSSAPSPQVKLDYYN